MAAVSPAGRSAWIVAGAAVLIAVVAGAWYGLRDVRTGELSAEAPGSSSVPGPDPEPDPETVVQTGDAEFDSVVAELAAYVEAERGLSFVEPVEVEVADDEEFSARLLEDFDEESEDIQLTDQALTALGLIRPEVDLVAELRAFYDVGVLGFYDAETDELVVRGTDPTLYTQQTIVHELVHALDDQHHDLDRPELDDAPDESSFGFAALVEGNARRVEEAWEAGLSADEQDRLLEEEYAYPAEAGLDFSDFPLVLVELVQAPYELGQPLVEEVLEESGPAGLEDAFAAPPVTSEQVIHPDTFLAGEAARDVAPPPADGEVTDEGVFGELVLRLLLEGPLPSAEARRASAGWGGDWYVMWREGDRACIRADFAGDGPEDREELLEGLSTWAEEHPRDRRVSRRPRPAHELRVRGTAGRPREGVVARRRRGRSVSPPRHRGSPRPR